mmetsp:Transcript_127564/g.291557  ORF Transcript_127564/g.291557 Transcript_127564/m.291557 type:complete len:180 (+) Transcript_127564:243-782(+)
MVEEVTNFQSGTKPLEGSTPLATRLHVHPFGLGAETAVQGLSARGQQTSTQRVMEWSGSGLFFHGESDGAEVSTVVVKNASQVMQEIKDLEHVDLLAMNCMGCEYDVLRALISAGLMHRILHVQFCSNMVLPVEEDTGVLGDRINRAVWTYCDLQEALRATHDLVKGVPWSVERWRRRS